ncbi:ParB/Srx family N-terminal domain-containing protein, partial [Protofrankia symbiont of Coriaria myrtifolia]
LHLTPALHTASAGIPPPDPAQLTQAIRDRDAAQIRLEQARGAARGAQDDLDAARRLALAAGRLRADAAHTCGQAIRDASDAGIRNKRWWSWEKIRQTAGSLWHTTVRAAQITVAVLGVVALVIGGPAAWIVFAAALVVLADTLARYTAGEASGWDVGLALLGCIPGTRGLTTTAGLARGLRMAGGALRDGRVLTGLVHGSAITHSILAAARTHLTTLTTNLRDASTHVTTILRNILGPFPSPALAMAGGEPAGRITGRILRTEAGTSRGVARAWTPPVHSLENPHTIRFSQENVSPQTHDDITLPELVESMRTEGWRGKPIDVVELPDKSLLSIDNRRLLAAREAGIDVPVIRHHPDEPFPEERGKSRFFRPNNNIRQLSDGSLVRGGMEGEILYKKKARPLTWGEAALFRTARQPNNPDGSRFPLLGRLEPPRILAGK